MFRFKQFKINQTHSAMKIGTDGVLLGAWATHRNPKHILDIGTGTGLIALMLAQRFSHAKIAAVEIDKTAFCEAKENFKNSNFADRILIKHTDIQHYNTESMFDLIVSNPPFFEHSLPAGSTERTTARHETLSLQELLFYAKKLLNPNGNFCLIFPANRQKELIEKAENIGLFFEKIVHVRGRKTSEVKRILVCLGLTPSHTLTDELTIETARHEYTEEYIELTKDFYLKM
ncbi:MAG: methyltransferase [Flavobacteriales bacterium]|nr:methyltransferase [Flavobacteriales bacterium]